MIKILLATGIYPPESGGPATYTKLLEERLPALGFDVHVLPFRAVRHLPKLVRHAAYFFACLSAARKVDIVYAQDTVSVGLPSAIAALLLGKKFVVRVPGDYAWEQARQRFGVTDELDMFQAKRYGLRTEILRSIQRFVVLRAKVVIVPSEYMKKIVLQWGAKRVERVYSSVQLDANYVLPTHRPQGFLVVSTGRSVPWKGFDGIKRVVSREKSWNFFQAEGLVKSDALGWVKTADVFVLNSTYEGLSHALIEAMSLGTPIVATHVGGNPELITNNVTGLLIEPKDDEALYVAIKNIEQHKEVAIARAGRAKDKAQDFSIHTTIVQLATLLKTL